MVSAALSLTTRCPSQLSGVNISTGGSAFMVSPSGPSAMGMMVRLPVGNRDSESVYCALPPSVISSATSSARPLSRTSSMDGSSTTTLTSSAVTLA